MTGKKGSSPNVSKYFKLDGNKLSRLRKNCSRCGKGVFMSQHKDRHTCGKCGLTEFNQ
jgi:small subunit ribosomal protein S27Ae